LRAVAVETEARAQQAVAPIELVVPAPQTLAPLPEEPKEEPTEVEAASDHDPPEEEIEPVARDGWYAIPVDIDTAKYDELELTLRADSGELCQVAWSIDLLSWKEEQAYLQHPILADGAEHTYRIPLHDERVLFRTDAGLWYGYVETLFIRASDASDNPGEVIGARLVRNPDAPPRRLAIKSETHEVLRAREFEWEVFVEPGAVFETHIGMHPWAWREERSGGVRFSVTAQHGRRDPIEIGFRVIRKRFEDSAPGWVQLQAELDAYEGEWITLRLETDRLINPNRDLAYWGDPTVFKREDPVQGTPVILISCDTLRTDHLDFHGYDRETTPFLSKWIEEAVVFDNATTVEPWTLTAHTSMLTGLYPKSHRVSHMRVLDEAVLTAPEYLRERGYRTGGFTGHGWWLVPWRGFGQGFDSYVVPPRDRLGYQPVDEVFPLVQEWLGFVRGAPFFLFFHNYDIHSKGPDDSDLPYEPANPAFHHFSKAFESPPGLTRELDGERVFATNVLNEANAGRVTFSEAEIAYMNALYDDSIRYVDDMLERFVDLLKKEGVYDQALIIITSDHGEAFGERGMYLHQDPYEPCSRIPMLIKFPNGQFAGQRSAQQVQLPDLFPTIIDVLGEAPVSGLDGQSLLDVIAGDAPARPYAYIIEKDSAETIRSDRWRLHHFFKENRWELYDLQADPGETHNLYDEKPDALPKLQKALLEFYARDARGWQLQFDGHGIERSVKLRFNAQGGFTNGTVQQAEHGKDFVNADEDSALLFGLIHLTDGDADRAVVAPTNAEAPVSLRLLGEGSLHVQIGTVSQVVTLPHQMVLDPSEAALAEPAPLADYEHPTLRIWYAPDDPGMLDTLTDAEREELESLGYTGL
jgi:arylsulfatase A-like enzyme